MARASRRIGARAAGQRGNLGLVGPICCCGLGILASGVRKRPDLSGFVRISPDFASLSLRASRKFQVFCRWRLRSCRFLAAEGSCCAPSIVCAQACWCADDWFSVSEASGQRRVNRRQTPRPLLMPGIVEGRILEMTSASAPGDRGRCTRPGSSAGRLRRSPRPGARPTAEASAVSRPRRPD